MQGKKVLVVEDDPKSLYALRAILEERGCVVDACVDAEQAHQKVNGDYDVALIDVRLPKQLGTEFAKMLRNVSPRVKIVFMTAYNGLPRIRESIPGASVVTKPIDMRLLENLF